MQVLLAHGSRSWGVHNAPKLGDLSDGLSGDLSGRIEGITDPDLAASLTAAEVAQRTLSQELDRHEQAGTGTPSPRTFLALFSTFSPGVESYLRFLVQVSQIAYMTAF